MRVQYQREYVPVPAIHFNICPPPIYPTVFLCYSYTPNIIFAVRRLSHAPRFYSVACLLSCVIHRCLRNPVERPASPS
jgi:hypothetical protein